MTKIEVRINGVAYPCRPTMGAMLRFKNETGKEVTELSNNELSELCIYLYCCVASACAADKVDFDYKLMDFADAIDQSDLTEWVEQMQSDSAEEGEEKKSL